MPERFKVVLIGDAAHTMRPTFGQGAALAMEDALASYGKAALAHRYTRTITLYGISKSGSYISTPRRAALERIRNGALWVLPDQSSVC